MFSIRLSDGSIQKFVAPVTVADVIASAYPKIAKNALAGYIDGRVVDLSTTIDHDVSVVALTEENLEALHIVRHSTAHLLAYAVKELFADVQVTIGPVIEDGFYYDFSCKRPFTSQDLELIEKHMHELAKADEIITHRIVSREEAISYFNKIGEFYKTKIIESIPYHEEIKLYSFGKFVDLCRGPHLSNTGKLKVFKLIKVSGAYWRGDSRNEQLQRIYGTAWITSEQQSSYLYRLEESEKRDHRKLGKQLDLFHFQDEAPGMVFWHPQGWSLWKNVEEYIRKRLDIGGYQEVNTPMMMDYSLWKKSGHWDNYRENMFTTFSERRNYAIKPMNCPGHVQIFNYDLRSYRDLPLRYAEFGSCHRNEPSGALHGLMRVRGFVQDDAHIFCTEDQINSETITFNRLAMNIYRDFGFEEIIVKLSLRPNKRVGSDEIWDQAENGLRHALTSCNIKWEELRGEGAFYGPKIEYHIKDAIGRLWQCGTLQLDFVLPQRLGAEYVSKDNTRKRPVILHRAILGSLERFIGILIENYAGKIPVWIAPVQAAILNISDNQIRYAEIVAQMLRKQGVRVITDLRNEKIAYKIRKYALQKIPYLLTIGDKESSSQTVAVRDRGGRNVGVMSVADFYDLLKKEMNPL